MSLQLKNNLLALISQSLTVSVESAESTQGIEQELVYYAEVSDLEALKASALRSEDQEQWEVKTGVGGGRIRCRCIHGTRDGSIFTDYVLTTKIKREDGAETETEQAVSEDIFTAFKAMSPNGMIKTRYFFPFEVMGKKEGASEAIQLVWEVDVFKDSNWVKIDLELPDSELIDFDAKVSFPFEIVTLIDGNRKSQSDEEAAKVQELYNTVILTFNPNAPAVKTAVFHNALREKLGQTVSSEGLFDFLTKKKKLPFDPLDEKAITNHFKLQYCNDAWLKKQEVNTAETISTVGFNEIANANVGYDTLLKHLRTTLDYGNAVLKAETEFAVEAKHTVEAILKKKDDIAAADKLLQQEVKRLNAIAPPSKLGGKYGSYKSITGKAFLEKGQKGIWFFDAYSAESPWNVKQENEKTQVGGQVKPLTVPQIGELAKQTAALLDFSERAFESAMAGKHDVTHVYYEEISEFDTLVGKISERHDHDLDTTVLQGSNQDMIYSGGTLVVTWYIHWLLIKIDRYFRASIK